MSVNNSLYCHGLLKFGTEAQKQKYLVPVASGQKIGAYSLTEPMSGSDAGTMKSRAVLNDAGHALCDQRPQIVGHLRALRRFIVLFTMTQPEKKHKGRHRFHHRDRPAGLRARQEGAEAGHPRQRHQRNHLRQLRMPGGKPAGVPRARASKSP
jgi:alkylation response protein AidB-like acyl-CoA dehydrogenase